MMEPTPLSFRAADLAIWWLLSGFSSNHGRFLRMIAIYFLLLYPLLLSFWFPGGFGCVHFLLDRSPAIFFVLFFMKTNWLSSMPSSVVQRGVLGGQNLS